MENVYLHDLALKAKQSRFDLPDSSIRLFDGRSNVNYATSQGTAIKQSGIQKEERGSASCGEDEIKNDLVDWDGLEDHENPKNWSPMRKWVVTVLVSLMALATSAAASSTAPALHPISSDLHITTSVNTSLVFAMFGLGSAIGALPYGPLSEMYGRVWVLHISFAAFLVFNIASGFAQTFAQLLVFRLLSGVAGNAPNTVGGGVVSDCFNADDIGRGSAFYGLAPRLGHALGPLIGGFIVQNLGWRYTFHISSMLSGVLLILCFVFLQETRPSVILKRKAIKLRKETGNGMLHTNDWPRVESDFEHLVEGLKRPFIFLGTHYIIQYLALFQFFLGGTLYLILSTYHQLFTTRYNESVQIAGLNYISIALGLIAGNQLCAGVSDKIYNSLRHRLDSGDPSEPDAGYPEYRVPLMMTGAVIYPVGFLLYGWSANYTLFWLIPNLGIGLVAVGIMILSQGIKLYSISTYGTYASSAQGAIGLTRSIGSGTFPLFAPFMLRTLGYGYTGTVLAGVAVLFGIPGPIILWYYGPRLRAKANGLQKQLGNEARKS